MSNKIEYISYGNAVSGENYSSGVEALAENVIEDREQDAIIVFPSKNGWASMRSESYRMTTNNMVMILPFPIYKIKKVLIKPISTLISGYEWDKFFYVENLETEEVLDVSKLSALQYLDATDYIKTDVERKALPVCTQSIDTETEAGYIYSIYKDNTLEWTNGGTQIPIDATVFKLILDETPVWMRFLRSLFYKNGANYVHESGINALDKLTLRDFSISDITTDPRDWQFRIEYIPMTSATKMRARKNAKTEVDYFQPYNQRAEVNSATAFGKGMYYTAQKTGVRCVSVTKNYKKLADIPPLGALVRHNGKRYRLVANDYKMTNTIFIQVTHTLSENWTSKSNHVSVDQKYRNWSIPLDMLWRNLYWEEFAKVSFEAPTENPIRTGSDINNPNINNLNKQLALVIGKSHAHSNDFVGQLTTFFWKFKYKDLNGLEKDTGCVLPCTAMAIGNSLVFSAAFKDNYSAGLRKETYEYCKEVPYCWGNGELDVATVMLACGNRNYYTDKPNDGFTEEDYETAEDGAQYVYPEAFHTPFIAKDKDGNDIKYDINYPLNQLFEEKFYIKKDRGEALKFTYQIHFIPDDERIIIGDEFLKKSTLIAGYPEKISLRVIASKTYFREGDTKAPTSGILDLGDSSVFAKYESKRWEIGVKGDIQIDEQYVAWAIVDNDNNIYLACNDREKTKIYIWLSESK